MCRRWQLRVIRAPATKRRRGGNSRRGRHADLAVDASFEAVAPSWCVRGERSVRGERRPAAVGIDGLARVWSKVVREGAARFPPEAIDFEEQGNTKREAPPIPQWAATTGREHPGGLPETAGMEGEGRTDTGPIDPPPNLCT
jgi:hypothetical protein